MRRALVAALLLAGCTQSGTGVDVIVLGSFDVDQLDVVAHYAGTPGRDVSRTIAVSTLPAHFIAELPDADATVRFDVTALKSGAPVAAASSDDVVVTAHHIASVMVALGAGDGFAPPGSDLANPWTVTRGGPPIAGGTVTSLWGASAGDLYATVAGNASVNLLRSTDRGATWSPQNVGGGGDLDGVWGSSSSDVFLVGAAGHAYHGAATSWTADTTTALSGAHLHAVFGVGADVYACGDGNVVAHRSTNAWVVQTPVGSTIFRGLGGTAGDLWAVGSAGAILRSTGGGTWTTQSGGGTLDLRGVFAAGVNDLWIVGDAGTVLHWNGSKLASDSAGIDASRNLFAVGGAGGSVVAVGTQWGVWRWTGSAWQLDPTGVPIDDALGDTLDAVFAISATELFAGGAGQTILHRP